VPQHLGAHIAWNCPWCNEAPQQSLKPAALAAHFKHPSPGPNLVSGLFHFLLPFQVLLRHRTTAMSNFRTFLRSGHSPTLFAAFLYFSFSCCIWVLNGAMAPFISETFNLTPAQKGLMLSIPIIAGAVMRFPLGLLSQYIGRKNATLVEMGMIALAMLYGVFMVNEFNDLLKMGTCCMACSW
jgi:MFS family permease